MNVAAHSQECEDTWLSFTQAKFDDDPALIIQRLTEFIMSKCPVCDDPDSLFYRGAPTTTEKEPEMAERIAPVTPIVSTGARIESNVNYLRSRAEKDSDCKECVAIADLADFIRESMFDGVDPDRILIILTNVVDLLAEDDEDV